MSVIDHKRLRDARVPLPKDIVYVPQKPFNVLRYPGYNGVTIIMFLLTAICTVQIHIAMAFWLGSITALIAFFAFQHQRSLANKKRLPKKWRKGLFLTPEKILMHDYGDRWDSIERTEKITIRCLPKIGILDLMVSDNEDRYLRTLSLRQIDKGQALAAVENWLRKNDPEQNDPTDATLNRQWLNLIENLHTYRRWIPEKILDNMPQYPYEAEELRAFTEKLKGYNSNMRRRDGFLTIRTILLSLACTGGIVAAGLNNETAGDWKWALLIIPIFILIWITQGRLRIFQTDRKSSIFKAHFWWMIILTGSAWAMMI